MIINSLFLQGAEASGGAMNALGMQKANSAGYLFSDIMKVHLGNEPTTDAGLSQLITGESELFSSGDLSSLKALIQNLLGNAELPDELKSLLDENNLLMGETLVTAEELENILAYLINQPNTQVFGVNPVSEETVELTDLEEIKKYLAENSELIINAGSGTISLKIDLTELEKPDNVIPINGKVENDSKSKKYQISYNFEKSDKPVKNNSETLQSLGELKQNNAKVQTEQSVKSAETEIPAENTNSQKSESAKIIDISSKGNSEQTGKEGKTDTAEGIQTAKSVKSENLENGKTIPQTETEAEENLSLKQDGKENTAKTEVKTDSGKPSSEGKIITETKTENSSGEKVAGSAVNSEAVNEEEFDFEDSVRELSKEKGKSEKVEAKPKVSTEAEIEPGTKIKSEPVNVSAKKSVKTDDLNVNGKTIVTNAEPKADTKPEVKSELNSALNNASNSETSTSLGSESDDNLNFADDTKNHLNNLKGSQSEAHSSAKFSDMIAEKINKEQFLMKPESSRLVKAAELVKEISKYIQTQDKNSLTIHLDPEHLGKVKIMMEVTDKVIKAHIEVDNEVAKHMVETNIKELHSSTQKSGLEIGQINISLSNAEQKNQKRFADKKNDSDGKSQKLNETDFLEEEKIQQVKNLGYNTVEYVA